MLALKLLLGGTSLLFFHILIRSFLNNLDLLFCKTIQPIQQLVVSMVGDAVIVILYFCGCPSSTLLVGYVPWG